MPTTKNGFPYPSLTSPNNPPYDFQQLAEAIDQKLGLLAHPVGSYYWSSNDTSPEKLFGGTWERVENTFIYAASDEHPVGETGGEETHTLTIEEMPSHTHYPSIAVTFNGNAAAKRSIFATNSEFWSRGDVPNAVSETGGDQPHNNMPPYIAAYCWHRTA